MSISTPFIRRPVATTLLLIALTLGGAIAAYLVQKIFFTIAGTFVYLYLFLSVPGSFDIRARDHFSEGVRIPPVRIYLDGEYRDKSCCILGLRGSLVREEPQVARAITQALLDAAMFTAQNPDKAAKSFQPYAPKAATLADLEAMARYHTHHHHPVGDVLKRELKAYADDLKTVSVFKPSTDTAKFAEKIYVDVFGV
jgi:hypothetical protein